MYIYIYNIHTYYVYIYTYILITLFGWAHLFGIIKLTILHSASGLAPRQTAFGQAFGRATCEWDGVLGRDYKDSTMK